MCRLPFHSVQGALASQHVYARFCFAGQQPQQRVVSQLFVIVQVAVPQRYRVDSLGQHLIQLVFYEDRVASVQKARAQAMQQIHSPICCAQQ